MTTSGCCTGLESQELVLLAWRRDIESKRLLLLKTLAAAVGELQGREADAPELETGFALQQGGAEGLREIDQALGRLDDGSYGVCERCDQGIAPARLRAHPIARLCRSCQARRESPHSGS